MGKMQRDKGARFERYVAKRFQAIYPEAGRNYSQRREGTSEGADVEGTPFHIECKSGKQPRYLAALHQAEAGEGDGGRPCIVVAKQDRQGEFVFLRMDDFLDILAAAKRGGHAA